MAINTAKYSVGLRLLVGFWLSIALAILCVWLVTRWDTSELEFAELNKHDWKRLDRVKQRIVRDFDKGVAIKQLTQPFARTRRFSVVLYREDNKRFIAQRTPFTQHLRRDVQRLSGQNNPLRLIRAPYSLIGPSIISLGDSEWLLFVLEKNPEYRRPVSRAVMLLIALFALSLLYSLIFSRQLLKPISALRYAALQLASGKWQARVDTRKFRRDELGELAHTFNVMAQKIDNNWQSQRRLLADVSHELRSPLARLNMAIALAEPHADNEVAKESLARIEKEAGKMNKLITDILALSRVESGITEKAPLSIKQLLEDVIDNAGFEASQKSIALELGDIPEGKINGHKDELQSAIENVIRNAIYYTHNKVSVGVTASAEECLIRVDDDGPGVSESELKHLFVPFYRSDDARNHQTGGLGLGLAITHAAIIKHGGKVSASQVPSGGLSIKITLPLMVERQG